MALLHIQSWAGRRSVPVLIVRLTSKRADVQLEADALIPGRGQMKAGDVVRVPRTSLTEIADEAMERCGHPPLKANSRYSGE